MRTQLMQPCNLSSPKQFFIDLSQQSKKKKIQNVIVQILIINSITINLMSMSTFKKIIPLLNKIVVRRLEPQTKTTSGIILNKPEGNLYGVIVEAGSGAFDSNGKIIPLQVKVGDTVLLPEFGGQKITINNDELHIYKETDIVAKLE